MSDVIKHSKKALSVALTITTIVWSIGLFAFTPVATQAAAGDLIKAAGSKAVYLVNADGVTIHPFPHLNVYLSWGYPANFSTTFTTDLSGFKVGNDVEFRDGSLVRAKEASAVFVKANGKLLPVVSYPVFQTLGYKDNNITWLPQTFIDKYTKGDTLSSTTTHPDGTIVKYASSSKTYIIQNGVKREFASTDVAKVNGYATIPVITIPVTETYPDGAKVVVKESALTVPVGVGTAPSTTTPPVATVPAGSGLTVATASDGPVAATILADTTENTYPQSMIPFLKINFTAGSDGAVKVTSVKFKRSGVSADSDIGNLYLYDGNTKVADYNSFSDKITVFNNSSGLFTVDAGTTKAITLKGDLARAATSVTSGKTIGFDLVAAADVVTDKATVSGSFPIAGALMSTAAVADLGHLYLTSYVTYPSTIKADAVNQEVWRFTVNASSQNMELRYVKMTMVGTILNTDIKDLKLTVGGVQVGATQQIASDKTLVFDLTSAPYAITSGQSKVFVLTGTMNGGASKTFKFTIQRQADLVAYDANYSVFNSVTVTGDTTAFALIEPTTAAGTTISSGTITTGVPTDSPSGNVADGATGVSLAKFSFTASGEDVKVNSLDITAAITNSDGGEAAVGLVNVKLLLDGSQIGTTQSTMTTSATATQFTFGNTFIVSPATPRYVTVVADLSNTYLETDDTIAITLATPSSANAQGQITLTSLSTTSQTGRTLTVKAGTVSLAKNTAFADRSSSLPTGTKNAKAAQIASFVITAGTGEASDVTQIVLKDTGNTSQMGDNFQNLKIMNGTAQIGDVIGTLDTSGTAATYTFTPSTAIRINAGAQYIVDVYADIKSSPQDSGTAAALLNTNGAIEVDAISATGASTSSNTGLATGQDKALQNGYISANGNLTISTNADSPVSQPLVMGTTDVEVAKFKLAASVDEDITISDIYLAANVKSGATGTFKNIKLFNGATPVGTAANRGSTYSTTTYAVAVFPALSLKVPKNGNVILTVKADISVNGDATTADTAIFALLPDYDGTTTGNQESITAKGDSSGASITVDDQDFNAGSGTFATDAGVVGNTMTVYGTKISVAYADGTPSGSQSPSASQTVMKFAVTNSSNVGNYSATLRYVNFTISQNGVSRANNTAVGLDVYKDSVTSANLVGSTIWVAAGAQNVTGVTLMANATTATSGTAAGFEETEIAAGATKTFIVILDTSNLALATNDSVSVSIADSQIAWRDGVSTSDYTTAGSVAGLPLSTKTMTY